MMNQSYNYSRLLLKSSHILVVSISLVCASKNVYATSTYENVTQFGSDNVMIDGSMPDNMLNGLSYTLSNQLSDGSYDEPELNTAKRAGRGSATLDKRVVRKCMKRFFRQLAKQTEYEYAPLYTVPWNKIERRLAKKCIYNNKCNSLDVNSPNYTASDLRSMQEELDHVKGFADSVEKNDLGYWEADFGDNLVMIYVPAGSFTMGNNELSSDVTNSLPSSPEHKVTLNHYWISKTPITIGQFRQFVTANNFVTDVEKPGHEGPFVLDMPGATDFETKRGYYWDNAFKDILAVYPEITIDDRHPVSSVSWNDAIAYTDWLKNSMRLAFTLPTEAEWEYAARGTDGRIYPWGNQTPDGTKANYADESMNQYFPNLEQADVHFGVTDGYVLTSPVGSFPAGASPIGALDMAGNLTEWVYDSYYEYTSAHQINPVYTDSSNIKLMKAGFWAGSAGRFGVTPNEIKNGHNIRSDARQGDDPNSADDHLGFRIAISYTNRNGSCR